jgi:ATP-dependent exoDNAse (exonuclease V) beta subunit
MVMAARPPVGVDTDPLFEFLRRQRREAANLEARRLLYVACTRAKRLLRLTADLGPEEDPDDGDEEAVQRRSPNAGSLLSVLWPVAADEFVLREDAGAGAPLIAAPRGGPLWRLPAQGPQDPHFESRAAEPNLAVPSLREEWPVFDWAGETARRVGTLVHAELHTMDWSHTDERTILARQDHFRRWLTLHGVPADRIEHATVRVLDALLAVRRDPRARWILDSGYRDDFREHALSGPWQGEIARVVFDRSFIDDGVRWVIDYKTSQHQGSGLTQFLDREVERYRPQLERYGRLARKLGPEPVRLGLYFPMMGAWREWAAT